MQTLLEGSTLVFTQKQLIAPHPASLLSLHSCDPTCTVPSWISVWPCLSSLACHLFLLWATLTSQPLCCGFSPFSKPYFFPTSAPQLPFFSPRFLLWPLNLSLCFHPDILPTSPQLARAWSCPQSSGYKAGAGTPVVGLVCHIV